MVAASFVAGRKMKVGDIVRQSRRLFEVVGSSRVVNINKSLGIVISIDDTSHNWPKKREEWKSVFGRRVTILMSSGKTMCVAENSLEVIDE